LHAGAVRAVNDVGLDQEVLVDELGAVLVVRLDTADPGGGEEDVVGALTSEETETARGSSRSSSARARTTIWR
jgi:hypothetical protein